MLIHWHIKSISAYVDDVFKWILNKEMFSSNSSGIGVDGNGNGDGGGSGSVSVLTKVESFIVINKKKT